MDSRDDFALIVSVLYLLFKTKISFLVKFDSKVQQRFVTISLQLSVAYRMWFFSEHFLKNHLTGNISISTEMKCFCRNELSKSF